VSVAVVGVVSHYLLRVDWRLALLYGAVVSSTDAAAVFSTLRRLPVRHRLAAILEAESGINDAPVVLLVTLLSVKAGNQEPWGQQGLLVAYELVAGAALGLAVGVAGPGARGGPGVPVLGRAARRGTDRARHHPAVRGGTRRPRALRRRVRPRRGVHPGPGHHTGAVGETAAGHRPGPGDRAARGERPAGADAGRPDARRGTGRLPPQRRVPRRAAPARRRGGDPGAPGRYRLRPGRKDPAPAGR